MAGEAFLCIPGAFARSKTASSRSCLLLCAVIASSAFAWASRLSATTALFGSLRSRGDVLMVDMVQGWTAWTATSLRSHPPCCRLSHRDVRTSFEVACEGPADDILKFSIKHGMPKLLLPHLQKIYTVLGIAGRRPTNTLSLIEAITRNQFPESSDAEVSEMMENRCDDDGMEATQTTAVPMPTELDAVLVELADESLADDLRKWEVAAEKRQR